jgi:hypothetical protein
MSEQTKPETVIAGALYAWDVGMPTVLHARAELIVASLERAGWKVVQIQENGCSNVPGNETDPNQV